MVVGGRNDLLSCDRLDEVEIINIDTNTTRNGESTNKKGRVRKLTQYAFQEQDFLGK